MKISVAEAVAVIFHCHDPLKQESEGRFGKSMRFHDGCSIIKSPYFEEVFKVYRVPEGFIVFMEGFGACGDTVEEAVTTRFNGNVPTFEFPLNKV